jgi:hypothetical protein
MKKKIIILSAAALIISVALFFLVKSQKKVQRLAQGIAPDDQQTEDAIIAAEEVPAVELSGPLQQKLSTPLFPIPTFGLDGGLNIKESIAMNKNIGWGNRPSVGMLKNNFQLAQL